MERISIEKRTSKTKGNIFLRFRVHDGRAVQLYYKSDIKASLADLDRFTDEGTLKKGYPIYSLVGLAEMIPAPRGRWIRAFKDFKFGHLACGLAALGKVYSLI